MVKLPDYLYTKTIPGMSGRYIFWKNFICQNKKQPPYIGG